MNKEKKMRWHIGHGYNLYNTNYDCTMIMQDAMDYYYYFSSIFIIIILLCSLFLP